MFTVSYKYSVSAVHTHTRTRARARAHAHTPIFRLGLNLMQVYEVTDIHKS